MKITIASNPWRLPSGSVYLEGAPTPGEVEAERQQVQAARDAWKPSSEARALRERLRAAIGRKVVVQQWDAIMLWCEDEGPYPMHARCMDVITQDQGGHEQAYLVLEEVSEVKTRAGCSGLAACIRQDDGRLLVSVSDILEVYVGQAFGRRTP